MDAECCMNTTDNFDTAVSIIIIGLVLFLPPSHGFLGRWLLFRLLKSIGFSRTSFSCLHISQLWAGDTAAQGYHGNALTESLVTATSWLCWWKRQLLDDKSLVHGALGLGDKGASPRGLDEACCFTARCAVFRDLRAKYLCLAISDWWENTYKVGIKLLDRLIATTMLTGQLPRRLSLPSCFFF